ncbi:MAG: hypothetical protein ABI599_15895 [Flavobacteriales bacterium]
MSNTIGTAATNMRAIKIDPDQCSVELIDVDPADVAHVLRSELTETIDFEEDHCLVIDDGSRSADHPTRFRFNNSTVLRPFFGPVLIMGLKHGNWASASLDAGPVSARIVWEEWDPLAQRYGEPAVVLN